MATDTQHPELELVLALADAWSSLEGRLGSSLSNIKGVSLSEFRLLSALGDAPGSQASRVDLARTVGLTPSGVTRALRPFEKLGMVRTVKNERDARQAMAELTPAGEELVADAKGVVTEVMGDVLQHTPRVNAGRADLLAMLGELTRI